MMEDVVSKLVRENQSAVMPRGVRSMEVERRAPACVRAGVVISASVTYGAFFLGLSVRRRIESPCGRSSRTATTERERERERERDTRGECQRRRAAVCECSSISLFEQHRQNKRMCAIHCIRATNDASAYRLVVRRECAVECPSPADFPGSR